MTIHTWLESISNFNGATCGPQAEHKGNHAQRRAFGADCLAPPARQAMPLLTHSPSPSAPAQPVNPHKPARPGTLTAVAVFKHADGPQEACLLGMSFDLSRFAFYQKPGVREGLTFACRTIAQRTEMGRRQTLLHGGFRCSAFNQDGLVGVAVIDGDEAGYPSRSAFAVINKMLEAFCEQSQNRWRGVAADGEQAQPATDDAIVRFADPTHADKLLKIQNDLQKTKIVLLDSVDKLLARGEKLDTLVDRSRDLSFASKSFAKQAKAMNKCCRLM